jgi:hypothetical protein
VSLKMLFANSKPLPFSTTRCLVKNAIRFPSNDSFTYYYEANMNSGLQPENRDLISVVGGCFPLQHHIHLTAAEFLRTQGIMRPGREGNHSPPSSTDGWERLEVCLHKKAKSHCGNKEKLPRQWKESIIVPVHKKGDKTDCSNYRWISLLSTSYKMLSNILLPRLSSYVYEIIGDHQRGFRRSGSATDQIFCIRQILEKKWEYNETVYQLFVDFKKAYDSAGREVLYNILIEFEYPWN